MRFFQSPLAIEITAAPGSSPLKAVTTGTSPLQSSDPFGSLSSRLSIPRLQPEPDGLRSTACQRDMFYNNHNGLPHQPNVAAENIAVLTSQGLAVTNARRAISAAISNFSPRVAVRGARRRDQCDMA
jgi:hypothetical protein